MLEMLIEIGTVFAAWAIVLYLIKRKGGERFSIAGPLLMWKTEKGKKFIEKLAEKKFWGRYGDISIIITVVAMILTTFLIFRGLYYSFKITRPISPRLVIGIPGINPVIPIGYGIASLALAIVFHEFSHGILTRFAKIKIKSLGLLFLILPLGAFVEPDEEKLMAAKRIKRARVFSAGPSSNIIISIISMLLLSLVLVPMITPMEKGVITISKIEGIDEWSLLTAIDGTKVENINELEKIAESMEGGATYTITYIKNGKRFEEEYVHGIIVLGIVRDSPAENKIDEGYTICSINGIKMDSMDVFNNFMKSTHSGEKINITYYYNNAFGNVEIKLANKYNFTHSKKDEGVGFIGILVATIENMVVDENYFPSLYNPFKTNFLVFISLPFKGFSPFPSKLLSFYASPFPFFWQIFNFLYWLFWLNFAIGTFNALPAIPLDGGYVFRDGIEWIIEKLKVKRKEKTVAYISSIVSSAIIISIFAMIFIPYFKAML